MNRFAAALRRTARELDLPGPVRAAILLELAADLEAAYEHQRGQGLDEESAARRAEELVLVSSEVVRRLGRLHAESWRGWSEGVGARLVGGAGLVLLGIAVVPMLAFSAAVAVFDLASAPASPLIWLVLATGAAMVALMGLEAGRLVRGRISCGRRLALLLSLSVVAPALGLLALALGVHAVATGLSAGGPDVPTQVEVAERVGRDGALFAVGLLLGISGALSWFVLLNRGAVLAGREVDALLEEGVAPGVSDRGGVFPLTRRRRA